MEGNLRRVIQGSLIGKNMAVADSRNKANVGLEGKVIDETKSTIVIETGNGRKRLIKKQNTFIITQKLINGAALEGRPEERIKK